MSLAAEQSPASTPTPASAPPANMPAVLNREPSQQDLEIARQLQSFQSQGVPSHENSRPEGNAQPAPQSLSQILSDGPQQQKADETPRDIQPQPQPQAQAQAQPPSPYQPVAQFTPLQQQQPRPQQSPNVSGGGGGQVCSNCGTTKTPLWRRSPTGAVICNACGLYYKARNQMRPVGLKRGAASTTYSSDNQTQERGTSPNAIQGGATYVSADQTSAGTCPGGGRCNGTGGHDGCSGCPAYNNRISKTAQVALRQASREPGQQGQGEGSQTQGGAVQQSVMIACQNCGTTITPLWRRDEAGNTICNACGLYHKLHGHHRPVQMKKAEIKRRKRVVPNHLVADDQSSVYTTETAEEERRSMAPSDVPSPPFATQHNQDSKSDIRMAGGPIPVDFTDTFRSRKPLPQGEATRTSPNPRKRSFSAAAGDHVEPYAHAQNMSSANNDNIDPSLPARNREPSAESSQQRDKEARRAALQAEAEKMRRMLLENERELAALGGED